MARRKARPADGAGQNGAVQNAELAAGGLQPDLGPKRVLRKRAGLESGGSNIGDLKSKSKCGCFAEKENVSSATDVMESSLPVGSGSWGCALRSNGQAKCVTVVKQAADCSHGPLKDNIVEAKNVRQKESICRKRKLQDSSSVSLSATIVRDENTTLIDSIKAAFSEGTPVDGMPFSSTPIVQPVSEVKNNGQWPPICQKSKRQVSSISSMPSEVTFSEALTLGNQFKALISKCAQLKDVPFSSTPMKNLSEVNCNLPNDKVGIKVLPNLVLSPIRNTRSNTNPHNPSKTVEEPVVNDDSASCSNLRKITNEQERDALFKGKPITESKSPLKEQVENLEIFCEDNEEDSSLGDSVQKFTGTPENSSEFVTSGTCSAISGSGEYDPYKMFILHDPITSNDFPDPRTSNFRNCEMKFVDFDEFGLPLEQKKPTKTAKKPAAKREKAKCDKKIKDWLQEVQEKNQEFIEIESMELCIE